MNSPLKIEIMFECYCASAEPGRNMLPNIWASEAATRVRNELKAEGLIDEDMQATERGKAWVDFICATPLPEMVWVLPKRDSE